MPYLTVEEGCITMEAENIQVELLKTNMLRSAEHMTECSLRFGGFFHPKEIQHLI